MRLARWSCDVARAPSPLQQGRGGLATSSTTIQSVQGRGGLFARTLSLFLAKVCGELDGLDTSHFQIFSESVKFVLA